MEMQQMHHHLAFLGHSSSEADSADFNAIFAGVSLQSLLLGEPVLVTPPPPPFPSSSAPPPPPFPPFPAPMTATSFAAFTQPLQHYDNRLVRPYSPPKFMFAAGAIAEKQHPLADDRILQPPTFFFQADAAVFEEKRRQPVQKSLPQCSLTRNHAAPRRQRLKVSEKLKALRRIVPCDKKADIATMLEQAYRYVRFLEAQVLALMTMQFRSLNDRQEGCTSCCGWGTSEVERRMIEAVGRLSRQEVVEAVVNSGTAQKVMYEEGLCLVSEEQVRVLGWAAFQKQQQQQQLQLSGLIGNNLDNNTCYSYSYSYPN